MNSLSIFVVEDEIITAKSIAKNIQKFGYQLAGIATSGSEAIVQILKTQPDLVLIDIFLGNSSIDGITVAEKIQSHLEIPVLYLTAHSDRVTLERAKITSPFGYILKPYSIKNLQVSIELALHKHQQDLQVVKREKVLTTILNATPEGIVATDTKNRVVYMNPAAESITQLSSTEEPPSVEIVQLIDQRTQQFSQPIKEIIERGEVTYLENSAILLQKNSNSSSPIPEGEGQNIGAVLILTRPEAETNSSQFSLTSDRLLKDLRTYLSDLILYELRTPLTVILSTAQSLESYRHKWSAEKQDKSLRRIQQAVAQIKNLLDNAAIWEELKKNEVILNPTWVDLVALSQDVIEDLKLADGMQHQLNLSILGTTKMVWLDQDILRSILANLLINGLNYSSPETTIDLSLEFSSNLVTIRVSDVGIGVPVQEQKQIFEPFYRGSNASKIKGTGLGLAIVKAYVQLCGGNISLSSKPQSKTTFTVSLPSQE